MAWQEKCIKALSDQNLFKDSSFHLEEDAQIEAAERHIIEQALRASQIIDTLEN